VLFGENLIDRVGPLARRLWGSARVAVITQTAVERVHGDRLYRSLERVGIAVTTVKMPAGERHKNLETVNRIYGRLLGAGFPGTTP